ncbi:MAG: hypothetical protein KIIPBIDF_00632 [Candidatus Methanoperedenaceae archaeon GB50]|nr:MAG: hypothetical protein KIIPBIDF_00632 [Candidatus Methanoperedenaceae archaeon GB50]
MNMINLIMKVAISYKYEDYMRVPIGDPITTELCGQNFPINLCKGMKLRNYQKQNKMH